MKDLFIPDNRIKKNGLNISQHSLMKKLRKHKNLSLLENFKIYPPFKTLVTDICPDVGYDYNT